MKETIKGLSHERLDQEIANLYWEGHRVTPGTQLQETGLLGDLWAEFDARVKNEELILDEW